jgi:hypothetical protein
VSYYQPPTSGAKIDPPLLPKSSVTIGFGAGSGVPYCYSLRKNQDIDIGHLKLFLSTEYVDLSHVPQHSPFVSVPRPSPFASVPHLGAVGNKSRLIWDTILIPVVQRRSNSPPGICSFKVLSWRSTVESSVPSCTSGHQILPCSDVHSVAPLAACLA